MTGALKEQSSSLPDADPPAGELAGDLADLYERTRARMGDEDLEHIRHVAAYSAAIKARSRELLVRGGSPDSVRRGAVQYALHLLLEFSELGHNILHGSYDELGGCGEFHSERWQWAMLCDTREWKVMHHQGHHPFANIVGKDHDIGYSIARFHPGQDWFGNHLAQLVYVPALFAGPSYYFSVLPAIFAAKDEGRPVWGPATFAATATIVRNHVRRDYIREPLQARRRFLHTLAGNYLGTALGHALVLLLVALEHHAPGVELFHDPGPHETPDQYYERQIRATTNFTASAAVDAWFQNILSDVDFPNPPDFRVFYGGLDTHVEHHLFPDLPPNRQREIQDEVRAIAARYGLPYHTTEFAELVPNFVKRLGSFSLPVGEAEGSGLTGLLRAPLATTKRIAYGLTFRRFPDSPYLAAPKFFDARAEVLGVRREADGQAMSVRLGKPAGWDDVRWDAGAFVSVRVRVGDENLVRQYSLVRDDGDAFEICVKRVGDGRVSNQLNNTLRPGQHVTVVGQPTSDGDFIMRDIPTRALFIAGGVGITPIISMVRKIARDAPDTHATLLYFNRDARSIIFEREIRELAERSNIQVVFLCDEVPSDRPDLHQERISVDLLRRHVPDLTEREVYACAPSVVVALARDYCAQLGLPAGQFHTESFTAPVLDRPAEGADERYVIRFHRSNREIEVDGCTTLLEAARDAGINVATGCEQGLCRACVTPKLKGITHREAPGVPAARVTVCNSLPRSDVELDL